MASSVQQLKLETAKYSLTCLSGKERPDEEDDADEFWDGDSPAKIARDPLSHLQQVDCTRSPVEHIASSSDPASATLSDVLFEFIMVGFIMHSFYVSEGGLFCLVALPLACSRL